MPTLHLVGQEPVKSQAELSAEERQRYLRRRIEPDGRGVPSDAERVLLEDLIVALQRVLDADPDCLNSSAKSAFGINVRILRNALEVS